MPWAYNVGSGTPPSYTYYLVNYMNQHAGEMTLPACAITHLTVYASGYGANVLTKLAIWVNGGGVVGQSGTFTMGAGSASIGGQAWQTVECRTGAIGSGSYFIGLYRNPSTGHIMGTTVSGNGQGYIKSNTSGFPNIYGMDGYNVQNKCPYVGVYYILVPLDITNASVSRNSDTSQTINWTNNSNGDRPYYNIWVDRWDNVTNGWYNIATIGGGNSSFTDTTTSANKKYRYRVLANNDAGNTGNHTYTDYIDTTPAKPSTVLATRVNTTVVLIWADLSTNETGFKIQSREYSGGSWGAWGDETTVTGTQWIDTTPYAIGQYKVRSYNATLNSAYVSSNEIVTITAPNKPTNLNPDTLSYDGVNAYTFTWLHNPIDGTAQSKYSIQYREQGDDFPATPQINEVSSALSSHVFAGSTFTNGTTYEYQVKTWGQSATGSEWSNTATFDVVSTPVAVITSPSNSSNYGISLLTVNFEYTQSNNNVMTQYVIKLYQGTTLLDTLQNNYTVYNGSNGIITMSTNLSNNTVYTITLEVKEITGLWSSVASVEFTTDFYVPATPTFSASFNSENASVEINIVNPSPTGTEVEAIYNNLYRNGLVINTNIPTNTTIIDSIPLIGGDNVYVVEAVSATPTIKLSNSTTLTCTKNGYYILNTDDLVAILKGDTDFNENINIDNVTRRFEGRSYPVKYQSEKKEQIISFGADLPYAEYDNLVAIINTLGNVFYRDYKGRYFYCNISNCRFKAKDNEAYQFSCNIERVDQ